MFLDIPKRVLERMDYLEKLNHEHRHNKTDKWHRLRQIPPETGKFLALLAACAQPGQYLEIGTSGGYSALWITLACRELDRKLTTFEILKEKIEIARETFQAAGIEDLVELIEGDAREYLTQYSGVSFCFLDAEKNVYEDCYEIVIPNMVSGGILVADNVISHKDVLEGMVKHVFDDERVDALVVPIGSGELVCRKI
jgi:predicted O-methyltransferase YrrM